MHISDFYIIPAIVVLAVNMCFADTVQEKPVGSWVKMPLFVSSTDHTVPLVKSFAIDKGGNPWAIINSALYYWDGQQFIRSSAKSSRGYMNFFVGGSDRDLYAVKTGDNYQGLSLLKLSGNSTEYITDIPTINNERNLPVYVSKSGKLYNWGGKYLAVFSSGSWKRIETTLDAEKTVVTETTNMVYFYYDGILCSADNNDNLESRDTANSNKESSDFEYVSAAAWSKGCALVSASMQNGTGIINLQSGKQITLPKEADSLLRKTSVTRILELKDGSILVSGTNIETNQQIIATISSSGKTKTFESNEIIKEIASILQLPKSSCCITDTDIWIPLSRGGIAQIKNNTITLHNWQNGAPMGNIISIVKGIDRSIYAYTDRCIYLYNPDSVYKSAGDWTEYVTDHNGIMRDAAGTVWMFLPDQPKKISCWKGGVWNYYNFPENPDRIRSMFLDDRGHILAEFSTDSIYACDFTADETKRFNSINEALAAAVKSGAKSFTSVYEGQSCVVTQEKHIALYQNIDKTLEIWDGRRWGKIDVPEMDVVLFDSPLYGLVIRDGFPEEHFRRYERGQLLPIDPHQIDSMNFMLNCLGTQLYDEACIQRQPNNYVIGQQADNYSTMLHTPYRPNGSELLISGLNYRCPIFGTGIYGGLWVNTSYLGNRVFYIGGRIINCDFSSTPLDSSSCFDIKIADDCEGNLWVDNGWYLGKQHIFMRRASKSQLKIAEPPSTTGRVIELSPASDSILPGGSQLFWNVDNGIWNPSDTNNIKIIFPRNGKHQVRIIAVDKTGCTVAVGSPITVISEGKYPETTLTAKGPFIIKDINWKLPVTSSTTVTKMEFAYRIDGKNWCIATSSGEAELYGIKAGLHKMEIAVSEDGVVMDPNPINLEFTYSPNWKKLASRILEMLGDSQQQTKNSALAELRKIGPDIFPEVRRQLNIVKDGMDYMGNLESVIDQLER